MNSAGCDSCCNGGVMNQIPCGECQCGNNNNNNNNNNNINNNNMMGMMNNNNNDGSYKMNCDGRPSCEEQQRKCVNMFPNTHSPMSDSNNDNNNHDDNHENNHEDSDEPDNESDEREDQNENSSPSSDDKGATDQGFWNDHDHERPMNALVNFAYGLKGRLGDDKRRMGEEKKQEAEEEAQEEQRRHNHHHRDGGRTGSDG